VANTTWNPSDKTANCTLTGSNLTATATSNLGGVRSVASQTTGKYYWEVRLSSLGQTTTGYGIANASAPLSFAGATPNACFSTFSNGTIYLNGASTGIGLGANLPSSGSGILCFALDMTNKLYWARIGAAGNWNGSATNNPTTGVGGVNIASIASGAIYAFWTFPQDGSPHEQVIANFGDSTFTGTAPSGFTAGFPAAAPPVTARQNAVTVISG
jgi:hypothetical protein